ncbi:Peptidase M20, dimerization [Niveomyces insectorum RCEF 264]|uniref:Peptidase M20, dimerization n=1 Tax=Niveomyces insectorum RCEF 264 TaxID=1081102 RepID=A0A167RXH4_9HYPO|nr:Peptidase M20, dimerization [Niveomyces insectorum RCEF 264]
MKSIRWWCVAALAGGTSVLASERLQQPIYDVASSSSSSSSIFSAATPPDSAALIALHKALVEIPSITGTEGRATAFLRTYLRSRGFTVETQSVSPGRDNLLAYRGAVRQTRVLATSHIDTVPPFWPYERRSGSSSSSSSPSRDDKLYGRGTVDAKGSVAAIIIAVEQLLADGSIADTGDVAILVDVGEERGGDGIRAANDLGLAWEAVVFGEPTRLKLARGHKGGLGFNVTAHGIAGHSGYPELGANAIDRLVRGLAALAAVPLPSSEEFGQTTLNLGTITGGVAANVIPEHAFASVSVRVAASTPAELQQLIEAAVLAAEPALELQFSYGIGPVSLDYDIEGFETILLSYGTDIPGLRGDHKKYLYGPGDFLVTHSDHEHLTVGDLEEAVEGYKLIITEILKRKP